MSVDHHAVIPANCAQPSLSWKILLLPRLEVSSSLYLVKQTLMTSSGNLTKNWSDLTNSRTLSKLEGF